MPAFTLTPSILRDIADVHRQNQEGLGVASTIIGGCRFSPSDVESIVECPAHVLTVNVVDDLPPALAMVCASVIVKLEGDWHQGRIVLHAVEEASRRRLVVVGAPEEWVLDRDLAGIISALDRDARNELALVLESLVAAHGWGYGRCEAE